MTENYQTGTPPEHVLVAGTKLSIKSITATRTAVAYIANFISDFLGRYNRENQEREAQRQSDQETGRRYVKGEIDAGAERARAHSDQADNDLKSTLGNEIQNAESRVTSKVGQLQAHVTEKEGAVDKLVEAFREENTTFKDTQIKASKASEEALKRAEEIRERRVKEYIETASLTDLQRHEAFDAGYRAGMEDHGKRISGLESLLGEVGHILSELSGDPGVGEYVVRRLGQISSVATEPVARQPAAAPVVEPAVVAEPPAPIHEAPAVVAESQPAAPIAPQDDASPAPPPQPESPLTPPADSDKPAENGEPSDTDCA